MRCDQFDERMNELLDARRSLADEQLDRHASVCPSCRRSLYAYRQLLDVVPGPSAGLAPSASVSTRRFLPLAVGLLAASLLLVIANWQLRHEAAPKLVLSPEPSATVSMRPIRPGELKTSSAQPYLVHQPLVGLHLLSLGDWSETIEYVDMPFGAELPTVQTDWMNAVATSMSPLQDSLTSTLNLIRRSITPLGDKTTAELNYQRS